MQPTRPEPSVSDGTNGADGRPLGPGHAGNGAPNGTAESEAAAERLASRLLEPLGEGARHLRTLLSLSSEQARLRLRRTRWAIARTGLAALLGAVLVGSGALYFARGLAGTLAALFGPRPWLGELGAGLLLLALVAGGMALVMAREERREIARLRRKYEHKHEHDGPGTEHRTAQEHEHEDRRGTDSEDRSEDGGAAARTRASRGAGGPEPEPGRPGF